MQTISQNGKKIKRTTLICVARFLYTQKSEFGRSKVLWWVKGEFFAWNKGFWGFEMSERWGRDRWKCWIFRCVRRNGLVMQSLDVLGWEVVIFGEWGLGRNGLVMGFYRTQQRTQIGYFCLIFGNLLWVSFRFLSWCVSGTDRRF